MKKQIYVHVYPKDYNVPSPLSPSYVMRLGGQHPEFIYKMTNNTDVTDLEFTEMEKDLGIHVDDKTTTQGPCRDFWL